MKFYLQLMKFKIKKKVEKKKVFVSPSLDKDYSEVPKHTLSLIEEAEETK